MPFNGSGGFISLNAPDFPAVANTPALAATFNNTLNDVFLGLGNCVTRDGQSPATANIPMGGFKHTGATTAGGSATGQYLSWGQTNAITLGTGTAVSYNTSPNTPLLQINGVNQLIQGCSLWSANTVGASFEFAKSRGAAIGTHTIVQSGDSLGAIVASGSDGTAFRQSSAIVFGVDGTPGASDMPGKISFLVSPDGSATVQEALLISHTKKVTHQGATVYKNVGQSFSSTPTLDFAFNDFITFGTLTGNVTATANMYQDQVGMVLVVQDGTGGRTFAVTGAITSGSIGTLANQRSLLTLYWSGSVLFASWASYL